MNGFKERKGAITFTYVLAVFLVAAICMATLFTGCQKKDDSVSDVNDDTGQVQENNNDDDKKDGIIVAYDKANDIALSSNLSDFATCVENMFYSHPNYAINGVDDAVSAVNDFLSTDMKFSGSGLYSSGCAMSDPYGNPYNLYFSKPDGASHAYVLVWSSGHNGTSETTNIGAAHGDDVVVAIRYENDEMKTNFIN